MLGKQAVARQLPVAPVRAQSEAQPSVLPQAGKPLEGSLAATAALPARVCVP